MPEPWPKKFTEPAQVGEALNWLRWRTNESALLVMAIGVNSIALSLDPNVDAEDLIEMLAMEQDTIAQLIRRLKEKKALHGAGPRPRRL